MKLKVGSKEFKVKVADTEDRRKEGLLHIRPGSMPKDSGLVLKFDAPTIADITMVGMKFPIDIIFVSDNAVQRVVSAEPEEESIKIGDLSDFVLEVPKGSGDGVKPKDTVEWIGEKLEDGTIQMAEGGVVEPDGAMHVLDENGKIQTNIQGDERIFSRIHTSKLYELANKAFESKKDSDYKKLGMAMVKMINKQDTQKQEYV